jgi:chromate transporter
VDKAFYGLRPASIAMISAAGINVVRVALINITALTEEHDIAGFFNVPQIILAVVLFFAMKKLKWHPVVFLAISAVLGVIFRFAGV